MAKKKTTATRGKPQSKSAPKTPRKTTKKSAPKKKSADSRVRLQRVMANAGIGSRRECELIIEEGRVEIDGEVVTTLGVKVDPNKQQIFVDAQELVVQRPQYFILNKPPGILSTSKDPAGRPRVIDLIKTDQRVYNVGRLDQSSEGLILVTNDGDLANHLTHPRYGVEKKYHVEVVGTPDVRDLKKLEEGVYIAEGLARATRAKILKKAKSGCWLEIVLAEGRNREIRRMLAGIGHKVRTLKRVSIGPLKLGDLPLGAHRPLKSSEVKLLKNASSETHKKKRRKKPAKTEPEKHESGERDSDSGKRPARKSAKRSPHQKTTRREPGERDSDRGKRPARKSAKRTTKKKPVRRETGTGKRGAAKGRPLKKTSAKPRRGAKKSTKRRK